MRDRFNEQLDRLHQELIHMGALCEDAIAAASQALLQGDMSLAKEACDLEEEIDQAERSVQDLCLKLLLQQQPVARDLRDISAALKMISDLERIGDQAADIAELTEHIQSPEHFSKVHIREMTQAVIDMVTNSVDSFVKRDLALARAVCDADDRVDALFDQVKAELTEQLTADPSHSEEDVDMLMVAKYLERIGDHATNVAEWVEYAVTGRT